MNKNLISTLKGAGFKVVTGKKNVLMGIEDTADSSEKDVRVMESSLTAINVMDA